MCSTRHGQYKIEKYKHLTQNKSYQTQIISTWQQFGVEFYDLLLLTANATKIEKW